MKPLTDRSPAAPEDPIQTGLQAGMVGSLVDAHRRAHGGDEHVPALWQALNALWQASAAGQVCLELAEAWSDDVRGTIEVALRSSPLVGDGSHDARPLVLEHGRLFRRRDWLAERALADGLSAIARAVGEHARAAAAAPDRAADDGLNPDQRRALDNIRRGRLLVLSGGPGTGKTHTLGALVRAALAGDPGVRIAVAAPTGKAATRLGESLQPLDEHAAVTIGTVHRLLGYRPDGRVARDAMQPIDADLVVVDECSMLDSGIAAALVSALAPGARLVLAGDRDQLASVQAGAFFGALCQSTSPALVAARVVLSENYRQREAPTLMAFAAAVSRGDDPTPYFAEPESAPAPAPAPDGRSAPVALAAGDTPDPARETADGSFTLRRRPSVTLVETEQGARNENGHWRGPLLDALIGEAIRGFRPLVVAAARVADAAQALAMLHDFRALRVLSSLRSGPAGAVALNERIVRGLFGPGAELTAGRLVVVRRNQPALELFNGDIGLVWRADGGIFVSFESGICVPVSRLPSWDDAFVLTVHQAQGSEFDEVLLLPAPAGHPMATREALYTGVTRARQGLIVFADAESLRFAAATPGRQQRSLQARLDA
ncbi:MAG: AAA family ATPase [Burkholderiaceae bacterium]